MRRFCVTYTNMLVSKNTKTPDDKPKICVSPTQNPNASQWNIGCVGYQTQNSRIGHVHFHVFCVSFAFGSQRKPSFQWNMGLSVFLMLLGQLSPMQTKCTCNANNSTYITVCVLIIAVMSMNSSLIEHHSQCCHLVSVTCKINTSASHYNNMASGLLSLIWRRKLGFK